MSRKAVIDQLKSQIKSLESDGRKLNDDVFRSDIGEDAPSCESHVATAPCVPDETEAERAFKKIIALVNASDKSEQTIRERLAASDFSETAIEQAIGRAKEYSFIDDMRFGELLVRSRVSQGRGKEGIERELKQHGIEPDSLQFLQSEEDVFGDQLAHALELLEKKPPRSKNLREGAYRKLVQRGYSPSIASSAARMWVDGNVFTVQ